MEGLANVSEGSPRAQSPSLEENGSPSSERDSPLAEKSSPLAGRVLSIVSNEFYSHTQKIQAPAATADGLVTRVKNEAVKAFENVSGVFVGGNSTSKDQKYQVGLEEYVNRVGSRTIERVLERLSQVDLISTDYKFPTFLGKMYQLLYLLQYRTLLSYKMGYVRSGAFGAEHLDPRSVYQSFVVLFDGICQEAIRKGYFDREENIPRDEVESVQLLLRLAKARWAEVNVSGYAEQLLQLLSGLFEESHKQVCSIGSSERPVCPIMLDELDMEKMLMLFAQFSKMIEVGCKKGVFKEHTKSVLAGSLQQFRGAYWGADYSAEMNVPNVLIHYATAIGGEDPCQVIHMRHPSPTRKNQTISPNYHVFIEDLKRERKALLYACHQRKNSNAFFEEDESPRTRNIQKLEQEHENAFVVVQPMEGPVFDGEEEEASLLREHLLRDLFEEIDDSWGAVPRKFGFGDALKGDKNREERERIRDFYIITKGGSCLPPNIRLTNEEEEAFKVFAYREELGRIFDFIHQLFFDEENVLTKEDKQELLMLFYDFQRFHLEGKIALETRYKVGAVTTACKDNLDRGQANAFVRLALMAWLLNKQNDTEYLKQMIIRTVMPPFLVGKRAMYEKRVKLAFCTVQKILNIFEQHPERLVLFKEEFVELTNVRLFEAEMESADYQTAKVQLGAPGITEGMFQKRLNELKQEGDHPIAMPRVVDEIQQSFEEKSEKILIQIDRDMSPGGIQRFMWENTLINPDPFKRGEGAHIVEEFIQLVASQVGQENVAAILPCCQQGVFSDYLKAIQKEIGPHDGMNTPVEVKQISLKDGTGLFGFNKIDKPLQVYRVVSNEEGAPMVKVRGHFTITRCFEGEVGEDVAIVQLDITMDPYAKTSTAVWRVLPLDGIEKGPGY